MIIKDAKLQLLVFSFCFDDLLFHQDSEEKEFSSFIVQALEPALCLVSSDGKATGKITALMTVVIIIPTHYPNLS